MISLDSVYAMLARPVIQVSKRKRIVEQTEHIEAIHADSHEAPQAQLPPHLERRKQKERRANPRGDRRGRAHRKAQEQRAQDEAMSSPLPRIDIEV